MTLDYYNWLQEQPERQELEKRRDGLREQFQEHDRNAARAMRKSFAYYASAERVEEALHEWQCTSETDDDSMQKIYGIHPELFVDGQMDVVVTLRQLAFQASENAADLNKAARVAQQAFDAAINEIGKQYDDLKPKWEALQTKEDKTDSKEKSK
jgi:hypothetical protein